MQHLHDQIDGCGGACRPPPSSIVYAQHIACASVLLTSYAASRHDACHLMAPEHHVILMVDGHDGTCTHIVADSRPANRHTDVQMLHTSSGARCPVKYRLTLPQHKADVRIDGHDGGCTQG